MIQSPEAVGLVIDALNTLGKPYIVTGSIVSSAYSEPRATKDADFVVQVDQEEFRHLRELLAENFEQEPQMSFETVTGKLQHKFRYKKTPFLVEIFEANFDDPHDRSRFERREEHTLLGRPTYFPTVEDVIVGKLRWYHRIHRAKDREDILRVMLHQWSTLDWPYIELWCREHGTADELATLRGEVESQLPDLRR